MHLKTLPAKPDGFVHLTVANNALLEAPIYEEHHRGTNYLAVIDIDGTMPGGLGRHFINKGRGPCLYFVEQLAKFDAVEFAADYTTSVGKKNRCRWYGVIVAKKPDELILAPCDTGVDAVLYAKRLRDVRDSGALKVRVGT